MQNRSGAGSYHIIRYPGGLSAVSWQRAPKTATTATEPKRRVQTHKKRNCRGAVELYRQYIII